MSYVEIELPTQPGLSGLAADDGGGLWAVSERGREAYHITLSNNVLGSVDTYPITGIPDDTDLEAMEVLGGGRFAFGTETKRDGVATIATAELHDGVIEVTGSIGLTSAKLGLDVTANEGAEGVCGADRTLVVGIETTATTNRARWAPLVRIEGKKVVRVYHLLLTTATGKISGLDCTVAEDGHVTGWLIERDFDVTKLLRFTLPAVGRGPDDVVPTESLDLGPRLQGRLNLEGIAEMTDGRVAAVVDNQWKTITGPSLLLVFPSGALP